MNRKGQTLQLGTDASRYLLLVVREAPGREGAWSCLVLLDAQNPGTEGTVVSYSEETLAKFFEEL